MKILIRLLIFALICHNIFGQEKKETVYLLFDSKSKEKCRIEVKELNDNPDGYSTVKKYRKYYQDEYNIIFCICDEEFVFNPALKKPDTCSINDLKKINFKTIEYLQDKYNKGQDFKDHLFKKISNAKVVKYSDVNWYYFNVVEY